MLQNFYRNVIWSMVTFFCSYDFGSILYGLTKLRYFLGCKLDFCDIEKKISNEDRTSVLVEIILVETLLVGDLLCINLAPFSS